MGENSKGIGERGEKIINDFLEKIGWNTLGKGVQINCIKSDDIHDTKTHGIDYFFSYKCPLKTKALENAIISVKFSQDPYPASEKTDYKGLKSVFKDHIRDLAHTIECYKKSSFKSENSRHFSGVNKANDSGILFWITDALEDQHLDVVSLVKSASIDNKLSFDIIYLVDNNRINFILDSLSFAKQYIDDVKKVTFDYINTGSNVDIEHRETNGIILPVQYLNSPILPIRIETNTGKKIFMLTCTDPFNLEDLKRLLGLTQTYALSYQMETVICFPDYNPKPENENSINQIKQSFNDVSFTNSISVKNFRPNLTNI